MSEIKTLEQYKAENEKLTLALNVAQKKEYKIVTDSVKQSVKHISISENAIITAILNNVDFQKDFNVENDEENKKLICSSSMNDLLLSAVEKVITEYKTE